MPRPLGIIKHSNDYAHAVGRENYEDIPKSVWAAIAVSLATNGGDSLESATKRIAEEWECLYQCGIVPQRPTREMRQHLSD
jgi:hypothetical protein